MKTQQLIDRLFEGLPLSGMPKGEKPAPDSIQPSIDQIMDYEDGQMDEDQMLAFFQQLVDSGMAWSLQGSYGRTAASLLKQGAIKATTEVAKRVAGQR